MSDRLDFERDGADWPHRDASAFVFAGGLRWHVQRLGNGPVALLVHGTGASTHSWAPLMPLLADRFTVVAPDLPGHAFSGMPDRAQLSLPGMSGLLSSLLKELAVAPELVVGHSAGAAIALRMCLDGQIAPKAIVSINGALRPFGGRAAHVFSPLAKMLALNPLVPRLFAWRAGDKAAVARILRGTGTEPDPQSLEYYTRLFRNTGHVMGALGMMANWDLTVLQRDLETLDTNLLLIAGSADLAVKADDAFVVAERVRRARVTVVRGGSHLVHEEKPQDVARLIQEFFEDASRI